jgi:hypothetical protein
MTTYKPSKSHGRTYTMTNYRGKVVKVKARSRWDAWMKLTMKTPKSRLRRRPE